MKHRQYSSSFIIYSSCCGFEKALWLWNEVIRDTLLSIQRFQPQKTRTDNKGAFLGPPLSSLQTSGVETLDDDSFTNPMPSMTYEASCVKQL